VRNYLVPQNIWWYKWGVALTDVINGFDCHSISVLFTSWLKCSDVFIYFVPARGMRCTEHPRLQWVYSLRRKLRTSVQTIVYIFYYFNTLFFLIIDGTESFTELHSSSHMTTFHIYPGWYWFWILLCKGD
jgi:hypothetical protein